jgi:thiol-disulfide isomerase/thioredoxin
MYRPLLSLTLLVALASPLWAEDKPAEPTQPTAEQVQKNPDDAKALNSYFGAQFRSIGSLLDKDPAAAEKALQELEATLGKLEPTADDAKSLVTRAKSTIKAYASFIALAKVTQAELEQKLQANPDDAEALSQWIQKVGQEVGRLARTEPDAAEQKLAVAKDFVAKLTDAAKEEATKKTLSGTGRNWAGLERTIESGKKLAALIGKDAAPLTVETWVNGTPLTSGDLDGKVVLLDFWAVWCGPCIATFPHLREWQEKYGDKGLEIIGLTRYYDYEWKDEDERAAKAEGDITPEAEQEMLKKFAAHHNLKHRFGIQKDNALSEYYGVTGIPHVVVIDQQGKVRMMRVGSGDANAKAIDELLAQLLPGAKSEK